ncbi:hypothetical protein A8713_31145 [Streptomyces sp. SAT1]|nr:hypothetical protein A8713_31145 [Streptomyces sp. SAT1]
MRWGAGVEVGTRLPQDGHHVVGAFEQSAGDGCLVAGVAQVGVGAEPDQGADGAGVAVVGGEHEKGVAGRVADVHRQPVLHEIRQFPGAALPGQVQGQVDDATRLFGGHGPPPLMRGSFWSGRHGRRCPYK